MNFIYYDNKKLKKEIHMKRIYKRWIETSIEG